VFYGIRSERQLMEQLDYRPQMPMLSWVGTSATAKVASPITSSVAISVGLTADAVAVMPENGSRSR
jgi:hypothetical protein